MRESLSASERVGHGGWAWSVCILSARAGIVVLVSVGLSVNCWSADGFARRWRHRLHRPGQVVSVWARPDPGLSYLSIYLSLSQSLSVSVSLSLSLHVVVVEYSTALRPFFCAYSTNFRVAWTCCAVPRAALVNEILCGIAAARQPRRFAMFIALRLHSQ